MPLLTPLAAGLPASVPFVGPETQERAREAVFKARLGANESVFGPSPFAAKAMAKAASEAWMYGDPESFDLKSALAQHHGLSFEQIMVGEGIDGLLGYVVRLFVGQGDAVVTSDGAYPTFNYHVAGFGGALHKVPYKDDAEDLDGLLAKAHDIKAKVIYLANPDNPMGSWHEAAAIERFVADLPESTLLVLDEAYIDTAPAEAVPQIDPNNGQVLRMRTFSKAYGLAGARVGYALGAGEVITAFHKVRNHFGMSRVSQAGALAALQDQDYLAQVVARIAEARDEIARIGADHGLKALASATNFVTLDCGQDGDYARALLAELIVEGIFVRMPFVAPQDRCIRVSCGLPEDLAAFEAALPKALSRVTNALTV
ncbi:MAG: pyridoxal phosphate-dependent aminotransferase [Pseudomonadota bacterium]